MAKTSCNALSNIEEKESLRLRMISNQIRSIMLGMKHFGTNELGEALDVLIKKQDR